MVFILISVFLFNILIGGWYFIFVVLSIIIVMIENLGFWGMDWGVIVSFGGMLVN